jgi:hypothetical protein
MPIKTEEIPCNFVVDFKVGDNLVFNADLLCKLTQAPMNQKAEDLLMGALLYLGSDLRR